MVATSKSSRLGFAAIVVALSAALGGCAESVGGSTAGYPIDNRNAVTLVRFEQNPTHTEQVSIASSQAAVPARTLSKRTDHVMAMTR
jgi:hypothetical protein